MTNASVHFRIDVELKEAVSDVAEAHGFSISDFYRFLTEAFLTSERAAGLDEDQIAELEEYREIREVERANERRERKEKARRKRAREIGDIKRFQSYVQDSIIEAWSNRAPPWTVKKDLLIRGEQIENWYDTDLLTEEQRHEMHRYVYECYNEYLSRWEQEEKEEEHLDDSGLDRVAGDTEEYREHVEAAATTVENTGASCPIEVEDAIEAAPPGAEKRDVLRDVHAEVASRQLEEAVDIYIHSMDTPGAARTDPNRIDEAVKWDPQGRSPEELEDWVETEARRRTLDDGEQDGKGITPPDPRAVAANGGGG